MPQHISTDRGKNICEWELLPSLAKVKQGKWGGGNHDSITLFFAFFKHIFPHPKLFNLCQYLFLMQEPMILAKMQNSKIW